jgi:hypothetical protein
VPLPAGEQAAGRESALGHVAAYLELLRDASVAVDEAADGGGASYWLKLELGDGRWTVDYRALRGRPQPGDVIDLGARSRWEVRGVELVRPRPPRAPMREFLVCAPAA